MPDAQRPDPARVVLVLYGPKAAGKTWVARGLHERLGVHHVDPDVLVGELMARGREPDPEHGWLADVEAAVVAALAERDAVSVEATGAWDSDWELAERLRRAGVRVLTIWLDAPLDETLRRLRTREAGRVPVTERDARAIHAAACTRAARERFDLRIDASGPIDLDALAGEVARRYRVR